MKKVEIYPGIFAGKNKKNEMIPRTCYQAGTILSNRWNNDSSTIAKMNMKPAYALSSAHDNDYHKDLMIIRDEKNEVVGYLGMYQSKNKVHPKISQDCFMLLQNDHNGKMRLMTNAPYSRTIYYVILAKLLNEDAKVRKLYRKLCSGLRYNDPSFEDCLFEKNKQASFEMMTDLLYSKAKEYFDDENNGVIFQVDGNDTSIVYKVINDKKHLDNITGWVHLDQNEPEFENQKLSFWGEYLGIVDEETPIEKVSMPIDKDTGNGTATVSATNMEEFLATDWSIMTDEEADKLPQFMQIQRKAMREFYEQRKNTMSSAVALKIKEMHDGKLKTLSLSGPAGTGKTFAARMIAGALNLPLQIVVGKAGVDVSEYLGSYQIVSKNGETNSIWKDGAISEVVRYGGILLFDEINLAEPEVVGSLNTLLDLSNCLCLSNGETLEAHPKFFYIEAMNIGSGFDGTNKMNNSHRRRMQRKMRFALPTKQEEIAILKETTGYENESILSSLIDVESYIRSNIEDPTNQYMSISEVQGWISEAEYTNEWIESACETILAPLMEQDETYSDYSISTINASSGFVHDVLDYIQDVLGEETYA